MADTGKRIFFSGIGGSGVSALANFMADKGHHVSGSDRAFDRNGSHPMAAALRGRGVRLFPQDGSGIDGSLDLAVFSTAVEADSAELLKARRIGVPAKSRPEFLSEIIASYRTTAVAGTSGKSTVAGMLAFVMQGLGLGPNFIGGGRVKQFVSGSCTGNSIAGHSDLLVVEACESDGSIVGYRPENSIILNLSEDHQGIDKTLGMFSELSSNTSGLVLLNRDDPNLSRIPVRNALTFSVAQPSDFRAEDVLHGPFSSEFTMRGVRYRLPMPGLHNVYNAAAVIALLSSTGSDPEGIAPVLGRFEGIERRFDILFRNGEDIVIDDYSHNPHKISALMSAVRAISLRACYVFQPHGYAPTRTMKEGYASAFASGLRETDRLLILPIYYAGGSASKDISSLDLAEAVRAAGGRAETVGTREEIPGLAEGYGCVVVFGARDETLTDLAARIARIRRTGRA